MNDYDVPEALYPTDYIHGPWVRGLDLWVESMWPNNENV